MPTKKPRVMLSVPDHLNDLLERLSDLSGTPKTKLIIEMLDQYSPILTQVIEAMEKIQADKSSAPLIAKQFAIDMLFEGQEMMGVLAKEVRGLKDAND